MDLTQILDLIKPLLDSAAGKYGIVVQVVTIVGSMRLTLKPIFAAIEKFIYETKTLSDDNFWNGVKENKIVKGIIFLIDYVGSIKLP